MSHYIDVICSIVLDIEFYSAIITDLCDDESMLTTTVTTEGINSATCPQKNGKQ